MKVAIFSVHKFEKDYLIQANSQQHDLLFLDTRLTKETVHLATGCEAISLFTGDNASSEVLEIVNDLGIQFIVLRSAGFNHVDLKKAWELKIQLARVPAYSPHAIAEHTVAMMLALNRKLISANRRIMELNFSLDGLIGFDMNAKTIGIIGTGKIGSILARIMHGFGCKILAYDQFENQELVNRYRVKYMSCESVCTQADIISLHIPLNADTRYIINKHCIQSMKPGVMLINTSRGGLVDTKEVISALKSEQIKYFGMDVYEEEEGLFFEDHSDGILQDDTIARLMTFKNVLITSHQAFLTDTALRNIAETTIHNLNCFQNNVENEANLLSPN